MRVVINLKRDLLNNFMNSKVEQSQKINVRRVLGLPEGLLHWVN